MDVRGDSHICIEKDGLKTVIYEAAYESGGYKAAGWTVVKEDWTKDREVKQSVDITNHLGLMAMADGFKK